jgi:serine/threonine-protein kinase
MKQLRLFLGLIEKWSNQHGFPAPDTVEVPSGVVETRAGRAEVPAFQAGKFPVTNREYYQYCRSEGVELPLHLRGIDPLSGDATRLSGPWLPVSNVNLEDAKNYCRWLSGKTGLKWRLPTEAEWMRAATMDEHEATPAGGQGGNGVSLRGNYDRHFRGPTVVGAFENGQTKAGCFDMAGNVWEWCTDFVGSDRPFRVTKGGAYDFDAEAMRPDSYMANLVLNRSSHVGFRVICD